MHNLYAIFAKFLNICKQVAGNLGTILESRQSYNKLIDNMIENLYLGKR